MPILNSVPRKSDNFAWRIIGDETIAVALGGVGSEHEEIIVLNETATRIWQLIDGSNSIEKIIKKIAFEYDCKEDRARYEIKRLFKMFAEKKMIA